jgi:hypothetical protein
MDFHNCISLHQEWKARLSLLLEGKSEEPLDPNVIGKDDQCPLGRWIYGEGAQVYGAQAAQRQLEGDFARLSSETVRAISRLQQVICKPGL